MVIFSSGMTFWVVLLRFLQWVFVLMKRHWISNSHLQNVTTDASCRFTESCCPVSCRNQSEAVSDNPACACCPPSSRGRGRRPPIRGRRPLTPRTNEDALQMRMSRHGRPLQPLDRRHQLIGHILRVPKEHTGVVGSEQRVLHSRKSGTPAPLDNQHVVALVHV